MVGWGFEPHSRATLGFLFWCGPRAAAAVFRSGLEGAAVGAVLRLDRYQSGIDHSLIDPGSGMVNSY